MGENLLTQGHVHTRVVDLFEDVTDTAFAIGLAVENLLNIPENFPIAHLQHAARGRIKSAECELHANLLIRGFQVLALEFEFLVENFGGLGNIRRD